MSIFEQMGLLTQKESFEFIKKLGDFWANPYNFLDEQGKKYFAILNLFPNKLWRMVVSMCFYEAHKNKESLKELLDMILPQIASYCMQNFIDFSQKTIPKNMRYVLAFYALIWCEKQNSGGIVQIKITVSTF